MQQSFEEQFNNARNKKKKKIQTHFPEEMTLELRYKGWVRKNVENK